MFEQYLNVINVVSFRNSDNLVPVSTDEANQRVPDKRYFEVGPQSFLLELKGLLPKISGVVVLLGKFCSNHLLTS
jgi:hypothetical protein